MKRCCRKMIIQQSPIYLCSTILFLNKMAIYTINQQKIADSRKKKQDYLLNPAKNRKN